MMTNIDVKFRNPYNNCILRKIIYHQYLPMLIGILDPLGAQTDRLRCEVYQNLILSPMNTGPLRPAVATVLTVYGIETINTNNVTTKLTTKVATVLTVYGIETISLFSFLCLYLKLQQCLPFTVLKLAEFIGIFSVNKKVATVLTVYGIETKQ